MKDIPPEIEKALRELRRLQFIALQKGRELQQAEAEAAKQSARINELWREHAAWLNTRLKRKAGAKVKAKD